MRKGQAAMEFLATYGFSFLVILSALGAMFYFGIFNVTNFVPSSCDLGSTLFCPIYVVAQDGNHLSVKMQIENNGLYPIIISNMSIKDAASSEYCFVDSIDSVAGVPLTTLEKTVGSRQDSEFVFEFQDGAQGCTYINSFYNVTDKRKYDLRLYYVSSGASQESSQDGRIIASSVPWS